MDEESLNRISVIIPVYNAEKTIERCLDSLLTQTMDDFEIIVINDGSKDKTLEILESKYSGLEGVRIYTTKNRGVSAARNYGLERASGNLVTFVDADDWVEPDFLEKAVKLVDKGVDVIMMNIFYDGPVKKEASYYIPETVVADEDSLRETIIDLYYGEKKYGAKYGNCRCAGSKFYRQEMLERYKIRFDDGLTGFEDGIFNLYATYFAEKTIVNHEKVYHYVYNSDSRTAGAHKFNFRENFELLKKIEKFLDDRELESEALKYCMVNMLAMNVWGTVINGGDKKDVEKISKRYGWLFRKRLIKLKYLPAKRRVLFCLLRAKKYGAVVRFFRLKNHIR